MNTWLNDACSLADAVRRGEVRAADAVEGHCRDRRARN
jgi:hypothetical protein